MRLTKRQVVILVSLFLFVCSILAGMAGISYYYVSQDSILSPLPPEVNTLTSVDTPPSTGVPSFSPAPDRQQIGWLSCHFCYERDLEITLWQYDGEKRTRILGSLPHGTRVEILESDWNDAEQRSYYRIYGGGREGWISEEFVSWSSP
jgi:hypothetical protein